jgi:hypothetical protein
MRGQGIPVVMEDYKEGDTSYDFFTPRFRRREEKPSHILKLEALADNVEPQFQSVNDQSE